MTTPLPHVPPRVLVISGDQWPRAGIRAELREAGYDAIGALDVAAAFACPARDPSRGPVRLIVVEQDALSDDEARESLGRLTARFGGLPVVLLAHATRAQPAGHWAAILRRPFSVGDVVAAVRRLVPLPPGQDIPLDR